MQGPAIEPRISEGVPFIAEDNLLGMSFPWNLAPGKNAYVLVLKATCDIVLPGGTAVLREEGDPPTGDDHVLDPPMSSLRYPSDVAVVKSRCDVTMWGHAYGRGRKSSEVRFAFGDATKQGRGFDRRMRVFGPRPWKGRGAGEAQAFEKVPLMWELAAKHDELNPVGRTHNGPLAPQIEALDERGVAGYGAIPMMWPLRLRWFGTYDMRWYGERFPFFAEDFDPAAFQVAPRAQQLDHVNGDEPFVLEGMHPDHRLIEGTLPGLTARAYAVGPSPEGGVFTEVPVRLDTVFFDLENMKVSLVWRGSHPVIDEHASDVSAWFGHIYDEQPSEEERNIGFWRRFSPEFAAMLDGEEPEEAPPSAPLPVVWLPAEEDPLRSAVEAWLAGGDAPDPDLAGAELSGIDFSGRDMQGFNLRGAHLERCRFIETNLTEAELGDAVAPEAMFDRAKLDRADLVGAKITGGIFDGASIEGANFTDCEGDDTQFEGVMAKDAQFESASLDRAKFAKSMLDGAVLSEASLVEADFSECSMKGVRLYDADATRARFEKADLSDLRADGVTMAGAACDGASGKDAVFDEADLTEICWRKASLPGVTLTNAVAIRARFIAVNMRGALMKNVKLAGADLRTSDLMKADLEKSDLTGVDLRGANLYGAELYKAKLEGAKLDDALLGKTILEGQ